MAKYQKYIDYMRDNPHGYWFKAKLFGWGWVPVRWQGWAVLALYVVAMFFFAATISARSSAREVAFTFLLPAAVLTALLIRICYKKGEKPRWQWGLPDQPDKEDKKR